MYSLFGSKVEQLTTYVKEAVDFKNRMQLLDEFEFTCTKRELTNSSDKTLYLYVNSDSIKYTHELDLNPTVKPIIINPGQTVEY